MTVLDDIAALNGLLTEDVGMLLYQHAQLLEPDTCIVEIGSYHGKSTCYLAAGVHEAAKTIEGYRPQIYAIDPWESVDVKTWCGWCPQPTFSRFKAQVKQMGFEDEIIAIMSQSANAAAMHRGPEIGLLYIDGNHYEENVITDFTSWQPQLAPKATVLFDDYGVTKNPGVKRAVTQIKDSVNISEFTIEANGRVARMVMA